MTEATEKLDEDFRLNLNYMQCELERIDKIVCDHVKKWRQLRKGNDFLGLYISEEEIDSLLANENIDSDYYAELSETSQKLTTIRDSCQQKGIRLRLDTLRSLFNLGTFEVETVLAVLALELDSKYAKLFAYLQDDVTKKKPTVGLVMSLFCKSKAESIEARKYFSYNSPLSKNLIFRVDGEDEPLLGRALKLDDRIVGFLLGNDELDQNIEQFARLSQPSTSFEELTLPVDFKKRLLKLCESSFEDSPLFLLQSSIDPFEVAEAFCNKANIPILKLDIGRIKPENLSVNVKRFFREARLQKAVAYVNGLDAAGEEAKAVVLLAIEEFPGMAFISSKTDFALKRKAIKVVFPNPTFAVRQKMWQSLLGNSEEANEIASKFRFGKSKAKAALESAWSLARMRNPASPSVTLEDLYLGCKAQSSTISHATKISPKYTWADIVLPEDKKMQLREICNYVKHYATVYETWGFDKHSRGKGLNVLFSGPSGTGKTMAAEILSGELRLDLYKIDLSMVVSKYIGETEKNLNNIFKEAEECNAVLFFDEADALFGKRSEVKDAHDRYANIEINYLLQKMEEHEGIAILATNMSKSIDDAFLRRMNFIVEFPFPTEEFRRAIWEKVFPEQTPLDKKSDFEFLAKLQISGGNIKNIALAASFLAAETSGTVKMEHIAKAARREFEKIGKVYGKEEFGKYYSLVK